MVKIVIWHKHWHWETYAEELTKLSKRKAKKFIKYLVEEPHNRISLNKLENYFKTNEVGNTDPRFVELYDFYRMKKGEM